MCADRLLGKPRVYTYSSRSRQMPITIKIWNFGHISALYGEFDFQISTKMIVGFWFYLILFAESANPATGSTEAGGATHYAAELAYASSTGRYFGQ